MRSSTTLAEQQCMRLSRLLGSPVARLVGIPVLTVACAAGLRALLAPVLGPHAPLLIFFLPVALSGYAGGWWSGIIATALATLAGVYLFIEPRGEWLMSPPNGVRTAMFVIQGVIVSALTEALHRVRASAKADALRLLGLQSSLLSSQLRMRNVIESAMDAIISVDEQQRVIIFNPAAERLFRCSADEALGAPLDRFIPERFRSAHRHHVDAFGETRQTTRAMGRLGTLYGLRADGEEFPLEASISHAEGAASERVYTVILRDITDRIRAEREREEMYRNTAEANRVKDEFLATLSHELRTPLNVMLGWIWRLQQGRLDERTRRRAVEVLERNTRAQQRLIEDLLDVSRIARGEMHVDQRPLDLRHVTAAVLEALRPAAEANGVDLEEHVALDGPVIVSGDAHRLQQVLWNLVANGIKFTPRGGEVVVRTRREQEQAVVEVRDTGVGIDRGFLPHVFERFRQFDSTTTRAFGGLGLGLAIVQHIVTLHGGTVTADSAGLGTGSTFTLTLPLVTEVPEALEVTRRGRRAEDAGILAGVRVLAVDDEPDSREVLVELMEGWGARVRAVGSAREALEAVVEEPPHVLVSDIGMTGDDGYALIRQVRSLDPGRGGGVPALALTAFATTEDRSRALAAGFQLHLAKPVDPEALRTAVARLASLA